MIGITSSSKNIVDFNDTPYLLDKYATTYVIKNSILQYSDISNLNGLG
jgi:hypothetical protein